MDIKRIIKRTIVVLGALSICILSAFIYSEMDDYAESRAFCSPWENSLISRGGIAYPPLKIVVKPWLGRHQVYAIFEIPVQQFPQGVLKVNIEGLGALCGGVTQVRFGGSEIDGQLPGAGHYLIKANLRTRVFIWAFIRQGMEGLEDPKNWALY